MKTRRFLSVIAAVAIGIIAIAITPRVAFAGVINYYVATDPNAGPIIINGIVYQPTLALPSNATQVQVQYPTNVVHLPKQNYSGRHNYVCLPADDILSPYYGKVQQPVAPQPIVPQNPATCPQVQKLNYQQPAQIYQPKPSTSMRSPTNAENYNGIINETERLTNDMLWYASERGWQYSVQTIYDTDAYITRLITLSNSKAIIYLYQQTTLISANKYSTYWWVNSVETSQSTAKQLISMWCAK
ncbi:hypothetical protein IJG79_01220 [Candidatus Saccharibacteria bacterium]|nr:hypothetical protein [Candidatus Saccharibacteria bacterium]